MRLSREQQASLVASIRLATSTANRNNATRAAAYLDFYKAHPEIEWALLAHLVSRNSGWSMTDLQGEWLPLLLEEERRIAFFMMLERSNWLIFHDAYAQLLLYAAMKERGQDLTELLAGLNVSRFMCDIWREFWRSADTVLLTHGLIVNEQQYIEQRVVQKPLYQERVLDTFAFQAQSLLSLNQVFFPYSRQGERYVRLCGLAVHRFGSVEQRINVGKALYKLLTEDPERFSQIKDWACTHPHTGSRADFWPHLFTTEHTIEQVSSYREKLAGSNLIDPVRKIYSPPLAAAWADAEHPPADGVDWFRDVKWLDSLGPGQPLPTLDEADYLQAINLTEAGVKLLTAFS